MIIDTKDAILYVSYVARHNKEKFGKTKLNKILYFADFNYYCATGERVTDTKYIRLQFGPVISNLDYVLGELEQEGKIHQRQVPLKDAKKERTEISCLISPEPDDSLSEKYRKLEIQASNIIENYDADTISNLSHNEIWDYFDMGEPIDFDIARAIKMKSTNDETREWASKFPITFAQ